MQKLLFGLSIRAVVCFLASLLLCGVLISAAIINKNNIKKLQIEQIIVERSLRISEVISDLLYKTQALEALVIQGNGNVTNFDKIAPLIVRDNPVIQNVLLAPDGIISQIYPLRGNESALGFNFFGEGFGNKEAIAARDLGTLVLAGPFDIRQGGQALAGRMPVYINTPDEQRRFWGLVSITLRFPQILENTELEILKNRGFAYELWRISPDTGEKQVLAHNITEVRKHAHFVNKDIQVLNAQWHLTVVSHRMWYNYPDNLMLIVAGIFISFFVLFITQGNYELQQMKIGLEKMATTDQVTGIYNRRYLEANLKRIINSLSRSNGMLSLLMIDVDLFKNYNDTYGHSKGDVCLKTIAETLSKDLLRADDFIARYGGEEFVVVLPNTSKHGAGTIAQKLIDSIRDRNMTHEASNVADCVTISIGVTTGLAEYTHDGSDYIKQADLALYMSKQNGRNRFTYLDLYNH